MKRFIGVAFMFAINGCAVKQPPPDSTSRLYDDCMQRVAANLDYAPLKDKIALYKADRADVAMLTNESYLSDDEKLIFSNWLADRKTCFLVNETGIRNSVPPAGFDLIQWDVSNSTVMATGLYSGAQSFGEYARIRIAASEKFRIEWARLRDQAMAQNAAQNEINEDRRRQAILMQLQLNQQRPAPVPQQPYMIPVPVTTTTNCQRSGDQVRCTSN